MSPLASLVICLLVAFFYALALLGVRREAGREGGNGRLPRRVAYGLIPCPLRIVCSQLKTQTVERRPALTVTSPSGSVLSDLA